MFYLVNNLGERISRTTFYFALAEKMEREYKKVHGDEQITILWDEVGNIPPLKED